jgi:hypothetical protein
MPSAIVTTHYRYRRSPRKRQATAIEGPAVVKASTPSPAESAANDDRAPARIVTARKPSAKDVPDMTPEEHRRRGDAADALFREVVRRVRR